MTPDELFLLELRNERLTSDREAQTAAFAKHRASLETITRLRAVDLWPKHLDTPEYLKIVIKAAWKIDVTPDDLPKLRTVFPQVKDTGAYEVFDAEKGEVAVRLDLGMPDSGIYVRYVKALPPGSRCQIVTQTIVDHQVVCGVSA